MGPGLVMLVWFDVPQRSLGALNAMIHLNGCCRLQPRSIPRFYILILFDGHVHPGAPPPRPSSPSKKQERPASPSKADKKGDTGKSAGECTASMYSLGVCVANLHDYIRCQKQRDRHGCLRMPSIYVKAIVVCMVWHVAACRQGRGQRRQQERCRRGPAAAAGTAVPRQLHGRA